MIIKDFKHGKSPWALYTYQIDYEASNAIKLDDHYAFYALLDYWYMWMEYNSIGIEGSKGHKKGKGAETS